MLSLRLLMGDSFVESAMNDYPHSLQGQLQLPSKSGEAIMNFGYSGASLPDYLGVASLAAQKFKIDWLVLVIVPGDFVDGFDNLVKMFFGNLRAHIEDELRVEPALLGDAGFPADLAGESSPA